MTKENKARADYSARDSRPQLSASDRRELVALLEAVPSSGPWKAINSSPEGKRLSERVAAFRDAGIANQQLADLLQISPQTVYLMTRRGRQSSREPQTQTLPPSTQALLDQLARTCEKFAAPYRDVLPEFDLEIEVSAKRKTNL